MLAAIAFIKLSAALQHGKKIPRSEKAALREMEIGICSKKISLIKEIMHDQDNSQGLEESRGNLIDLGDDDSTKPPCGQFLADTQSAVSDLVSRGLLIPRPCSDFWKAYGNKLRVFGTTEKIVYLPVQKLADEEMTTSETA